MFAILFPANSVFVNLLASQNQFRNSFEDALSYFVGGNIEEDNGFAIKPWFKIRFSENKIIISHDTAIDITKDAQNTILSGQRNEYMEESIRNVLISSSPSRFGFENITGLPWIEIDFAEDVVRAKSEILPNLQE